MAVIDATSRARRAQWPVRVTTLDDPGRDDLSAYTTAAERVAIVAQLTTELWAVAGYPLPAYERSRTPMTLRPLRAPGTVHG